MPNSDVTIRVENLGKTYLVPQKHANDFTDAPGWRARLKEFFPGLLGAGEQDYFWALKDVSFEVRRGEVLGIIGENGSGKSTMLKILAGVTPPSEGQAEIKGRVGSLLEVGTGFHPDLTGRENIFFNGALLGIGTKEIRSRLGSIIDFSGIGEFIDVPVKRYSSGMYVRLAYSVASLLESDILILDEVLAVGDAGFRSKSKENMKSRAHQGSTVLFVSHNLNQVREVCDRCIILEHGRMVFEGTPNDATARHWRQQMHIPDLEDATAGNGKENDFALTRDLTDLPRYASTNVRYLKKIEIFDPDRPDAEEFKTGGKIGFRLHLNPTDDLREKQLYAGFSIHNTLVQVAAKFHNFQDKECEMPPGTTVVECLCDDLRLGAGIYSMAVGLSFYERERDQFVNIDLVGHATFIRVTDREFFSGRGLTDAEGAAHKARWEFS